MNKEKLSQSIAKSFKMVGRMLPIMIGVILLISLALANIPKTFYANLFSGDYIIDPIIGALTGSIVAGNPITSYIIGGELLEQGISMIAITAFIVAWVTVGVVQFPAEAMLLGKKFALIRNVTAFLFSIVVALITTGVMVILT